MATRRNRCNRSRRNRRSNKQNGGEAPLGNTSMAMSSKDSLGQGSEYLQIHKGQYGGSAPLSAITTSGLPSSMVAAARTGPLDSAIAGIQGMQDGGRRRRSKKHRSRKHSRKHSGGKRSRKHSRKHRSRKHRSRKQRGGLAPLSASSMLLPPGMERQAALNYEWSMAKNPNSFAPPS